MIADMGGRCRDDAAGVIHAALTQEARPGNGPYQVRACVASGEHGVLDGDGNVAGFDGSGFDSCSKKWARGAVRPRFWTGADRAFEWEPGGPPGSRFPGHIPLYRREKIESAERLTCLAPAMTLWG